MNKPVSSPQVIVGIVVLSGVVAAAQVGKLAPSMPDLRADLGIGMVMGGWVSSTLSMMGVLFSILAGLLGDRFGAARMMALGLLLCGLGGLAGALADGAAWILMSRVVEGIGFVFVVVPAAAVIVGAVDGPSRRLAFGIWGTYMPTGTTLTLMLAPLTLAAFGWRGVWVAVALGCLACFLLVIRFLDMSPPPAARRTGLSLRGRFLAAFRHRGVVVASLIFSAYTLQWLPLMIWLPTLLIEEWGFAIRHAAWLTGGVLVINILGNLLGGWLLRHGVRHWQVILAAALAMGVGGVSIFVFSPPFLVFYGLCLLFSGGGGMLPPAVLASAPLFVSDPREVGAANGLVAQGSHLGQVVGPPAMAVLVAHLGGWESVVWQMGFGAVMAMALALVLAGYERKV